MAAASRASPARLEPIESEKYPGLASLSSAFLVEAEGRIAANLRSEETKLNLSELELTSLPAAIFNNVLKKFDCSSNCLTSLPDAITDCTALKKLCCQCNDLTTLPESLGECAALEGLYCYGNNLSSLPKSLGACTRLRTLNCGRNHLTTLPESLGECSALRELYCDSNSLTDLPERLAECTHVFNFYCRFNNWDSTWLEAQELGLGSDPTMKSLSVLGAKLSAGRVKPARRS